MSNSEKIEKYKRFQQYWEDPKTVSLLDQNLRCLEESIVLPYLQPHHDFGDLGCGNGISTVVYAKRVRSCLALEQSDYLRSEALRILTEAGLTNFKCVKGSVLDLSRYRNSLDVVVTQRVLTNLACWEDQMKVIDNIHACLRPGGRYVLIDNIHEGHEALNSMRRAVGLKEIPIHWHNLFFQYDKLIDFLQTRFTIQKHYTFDLYYLLTRAYVNMFARFEGYGADAKKDQIFEYADPAARKLFQVLGNTVRVEAKCGLGPVQGFILQKKSD